MLGNRLRELRESRGLSQKMVSIKLDISQSSVSDWEMGRKTPPVKTICQLAEMFGVTSDYLLELSDIPYRSTATKSPYMEVSPFEKTVLEAFRSVDKTTQSNICMILGLEHPAVERARTKRA